MHQLAETTVNLLVGKIKADIAAALLDVRSSRADALVSTEPPQNYFIYAGAMSYRTPAVFVVCESMQLRNDQQGANHINALARVVVSVLVEDRNMVNLVTKAWRYHSALHKILHLTALTSADTKVRIISKVDRVSFSPEFSRSQSPDEADGVFRKEVALELDVEHFENL